MPMKTKLFRLPLRTYFTIMFATTLSVCVLTALLLVTLGFRIFYHGSVTTEVLHVATFLICGLTILFGSLSMWWGASHLTKPIEEMNQIVSNVGRGEFVGHLDSNAKRRKDYAYFNELDQLSESINSMIVSLSQMDYMRKDFMSNVSHELKSPIAAISNISELLQDDQLDVASRKELTKLIQEESQRLARLIGTILQLSRVENQENPGLLTSVRIDEQIRQAMITLSEKWQNKTIDFSFDSSTVIVQANADLLMQVWVNLLDNAIKYSGKQPKISVKLEEFSDQVKVVIADKGQGMSAEELPRIFEKFYQADQSHHQEGNGLGLPIVQRIITLCDGTISVKSQEEIGTEFRIYIPKK